jgi:hypothetical protein
MPNSITMNKTFTTEELLFILSNLETFINKIKGLLKTAPVGQNLSHLRKMLYNMHVMKNNTRSTLDQRYVDAISTERLQKDIQRTAV